MDYLLLFGIMAALGALPLPLFPSWVVVAYLVVELDLRIWAAIVVGAAGTAVGRVALSWISRVAGPRILGRWSKGNLEYLHGRLENTGGTFGTAVLLASSPPPAGVLYVAAGLLRINLLLVAASAFAGRLFGYGISVTASSAAGDELADKLRGIVGPWSAALGVAIVVGFLLLFVHIDWRTLVEQRRLRLHRGGRRKRPEPALAPDEAS